MLEQKCFQIPEIISQTGCFRFRYNFCATGATELAHSVPLQSSQAATQFNLFEK